MNYDLASRLQSPSQNLASTAHNVSFGSGYTAAGQLANQDRRVPAAHSTLCFDENFR